MIPQFLASSWFRYLLVLGGLNLVWEIAQLPFYTLWTSSPLPVIAYDVIHCTIGDFLIATICSIAALAPLRWRWPGTRGHIALFLSLIVAFGVAYTIYSEWLNVTVRKSWSYSDLMPLLPPLDTGLSPVLQWLLLPVLSFFVARKL